MTPINGMPQFGTLATSNTKAPMAARQFQNTEFNFINPSQTGGAQQPTELNEASAKDFATIRASQDGAEKPGFMQNPVKFLANMFVDNKIANAAGAAKS